MEYDNDRKVKHPYKVEMFCWALIALLYPLVNSVSFFWGDLSMWTALFIVSLVVLPAYLLYQLVIAPRVFLEKQYYGSVFISLLFLLAIQVLLFILFSLVLKFPLSEDQRPYFTYNFSTIARESLWIIINMCLSMGVYFVKKALDEKEALQNIERDSASFKLKYLRSQLSPHFLFNTLNSIYSLSLQKSDKAPEMVVKLADLMRYMVYDCTEEKVPLNKEIDFIHNYLAIEKIRHKADVRFSVEGDTDGIMIEPFLFISFIENGFKHAFNHSYTEPFIYINLKTTGNQVSLSVVNNTNLDLETQAKRIHGTGIKNSKSLLELLYPASYELDIIQTHKEENSSSDLRFKHAKERLETLYPDSHTLDVILSNNSFTVSLIVKPVFA